jgi:hypothetical protein
MSIRVACGRCGRQLQVGDELCGREIHCPGCGSPLASPPALVGTPGPRTGITDTPGRGAGEERRTCPRCQQPLAPGAVLCIECGFNLKTGKQLRTVRERFERHWDTGGVSLTVRLIILGAVEALCLPGMALGAFSQRDAVMVVVFPIVWVVATAACVLLLGTFAHVGLSKTKRGEILLASKRWVCFVPIASTVLKLKHYKEIHLRHAADRINWLVLAMILGLCLLGFVPGLVFWCLLFQGSSFSLSVSAEPGEEVLIYTGRSEVFMRSIGDTLESVAGLRYG